MHIVALCDGIHKVLELEGNCEIKFETLMLHSFIHSTRFVVCDRNSATMTHGE